MKKKPLTNYPVIPPPRIQQFTIPQLGNQLLKQKQFIKGLQKLFSNCIISKGSLQPLTTLASNYNQNKSITIPSPKSTISSSKANSKFTSPTNKLNKQLIVSEQQREQQQSQVQFIFQQQVKNRMLYPWMLSDNLGNQLVECNIITDQITDIIEQTIETSLHKILNKQFINVTNQILAMRQEINIFTKSELERSQSIKFQVQKQLEKMQKKIQQQQHISTSILNQPLQRFSRNKAILNSSLNNSTKQSNSQNSQNLQNSQNSQDFTEDSKISVHHEIFNLKKQIQVLKKSTNHFSQTTKSVNNQSMKYLEQKASITQQKLSELTLFFKISLEQQKQKCKKNHQQLLSQLSISTSKQFMSQEVKKSVKSNLKIYLDEIMKCKKDIEQLYDRIDRNDKGMQQYIGNQLKNVWTLVSGLKTRLENVEETFGVGMDQSFVL